MTRYNYKHTIVEFECGCSGEVPGPDWDAWAPGTLAVCEKHGKTEVVKISRHASVS